MEPACRVVSLQTAMAVFGAILFFFWKGMPAAGAAFYGTMVALANTVLLLWQAKPGRRDLHADVHKHLRSLYRSSMERFFVVCVLLATGMGLLGLQPLVILAGFTLGQFALIVSQLVRGIK